MQEHFLYIDPGSGSYLVQMIIAAVLGGLFYIKTIWQRVKIFFSKSEDDANSEKIDE